MEEKQTKILKTFLELLNTGSKCNEFTFTSASLIHDVSKGELDLLFPYGVFEAVQKLWDIHLEELKPLILQNEGITKGVKMAVLSSFELLSPYKKALRNIVKFLLLPKNILASPKFIWRLCDTIWGKVEGGSAGFSYYSKRMILFTIYNNCFLYFITSKNHTKLQEVLEKQLSLLQKIVKKFKR